MSIKNVLFVCSANVDRSRTAEDFFSEQFSKLEFHSAGTNEALCTSEGTQFIRQDLITAADLIVVMEEEHRVWLAENLDLSGKRLEVLNIPDHYSYYAMELIELLQQRCASLFV